MDQSRLLAEFCAIVGAPEVLTAASRIRRFTTGFRYGAGPALAVVRPGTLRELWRTLQACVRAGVIIIMQSANTGLTGGSTPQGHYDRPVVLINTMRIKGIHPLRGGGQVLCLPGATLHELELALAPFGREPHSVIGSSCIGASVFGGICNNSGGSLVQRGPAYTELALFARIDERGELQLVNHLGIELGAEPGEMLRRLDEGVIDVAELDAGERRASDHGYCDHVRKVTEPTPARFNADPSRLYEASGSAGRVALFAVRLDTFPKEKGSATFCIGNNSAEELGALRRHILQAFTTLPISAEYIHRDAWDLAAQYGKDVVIAIDKLGTARLPQLFAVKAWIDEWARKLRILPRTTSDWLLQAGARLFPEHLPARMRRFRDLYEHHLILKVGEDGIAEARAFLAEHYPSKAGDVFECTPEEASLAFLHRFAVAGAAIRYRALHSREVGDIVALDIALRRNDDDWFEHLPPAIERQVLKKIYYGHFLCHVFHQDYILTRGTDPAGLEHDMLKILDTRGAEYPAEHNVGHLYQAKDALVKHYRTLDPRNVFNPGIGLTPRGLDWQP